MNSASAIDGGPGTIRVTQLDGAMDLRETWRSPVRPSSEQVGSVNDRCGGIGDRAELRRSRDPWPCVTSPAPASYSRHRQSRLLVVPTASHTLINYGSTSTPAFCVARQGKARRCSVSSPSSSSCRRRRRIVTNSSLTSSLYSIRLRAFH
jgi:hypothetical protein